jgi:hypothetical protein
LDGVVFYWKPCVTTYWIWKVNSSKARARARAQYRERQRERDVASQPASDRQTHLRFVALEEQPEKHNIHH